MAAKCANCGHVLVGRDDAGWYYQVPVTDERAPGLVFMDRVHECDGKPHHVEQQQDSSPRCDACDEPESHTFHDPDKIGKFSGYHPFGGFRPPADMDDETTCPECGSERWDYALDGRAMCVNRHMWHQAHAIPGTYVRPGYPGDINDPERYPD